VILAGSVGVAYVVLVLVFVPRLNDREQRKAIIRYELGFLLLVEIVISGLGVPVYHWAGWSTSAVAASHILAVFVASVAGLVYLNRVGRPSDMIVEKAWRNLRTRNPSSGEATIRQISRPGPGPGVADAVAVHGHVQGREGR
jgi:hypothetical protein